MITKLQETGPMIAIFESDAGELFRMDAGENILPNVGEHIYHNDRTYQVDLIILNYQKNTITHMLV